MVLYCDSRMLFRILFFQYFVDFQFLSSRFGIFVKAFSVQLLSALVFHLSWLPISSLKRSFHSAVFVSALLHKQLFFCVFIAYIILFLPAPALGILFESNELLDTLFVLPGSLKFFAN